MSRSLLNLAERDGRASYPQFTAARGYRQSGPREPIDPEPIVALACSPTITTMNSCGALRGRDGAECGHERAELAMVLDAPEALGGAQTPEPDPPPAHVAIAAALDVPPDVPQRPDEILDAVRGREEVAQGRRPPQLQYGERFLQAFAHTASGIGVAVPLQPRRERRQLTARGRRAGRPIRSTHARPDVGVTRLRHEGVEVAPLVQLAALDHRGVAEDITERLAQPLAAIDHTQHPPLERESAREQVLQQLGAHHGVLRRAQPQAQRDLVAVARDREDDDHRLLGHHDAVHDQRHHREVVQTSREVLAQPLPGPPHHGPTDGALATAPGGPPARPRLETAVVVAHRHTPASSCCIIRAVSGSRSRNAATDGNVASPPAVCRTRGRRTCTRRPPKVSSVAAVPSDDGCAASDAGPWARPGPRPRRETIHPTR